jgi:hypothetical protein
MVTRGSGEHRLRHHQRSLRGGSPLYAKALAAVTDMKAPRCPPSGKLITETFGYDAAGRSRCTSRLGQSEAVVLAGDVQPTSRWGGALEVTDVPSTIIVGEHRRADEMIRLHEY